MRQLRKEMWANFKTDGLLFEALIQDILPLEFPGHSFRRTPGSHDGARDFESTIPLMNGAQARIWIECKYRGEKLPAHAVSMTMVMALLDHSHQIIFFSYSPVNREFTQYVGRFQNRTGIDVRIYDDCTLEDTILRHWGRLDTQKYFNLKAAPAADCNPYQKIMLSTVIAKNGCAAHRDSSDPRQNREPVFCLNDIVEVRFCVHNSDAVKEAKLRLNMASPEGLPYFKVLNRHFNQAGYRELTLPPNAVKQYTLFLKLVRYKDKVPLPKFYLSGPPNCPQPRQKYIRSRWIAETPLVGQLYHDALKRSEAFFNAHRALGWISIRGTSGVGKSRLLKELGEAAQANDFRNIHMDAERQQLTFATFFQAQVSALTGLPDDLRGQVSLISDESAAETKNAYAAKILYDPAFDFQGEMKSLVRYGSELLASEPSVLIVDNVQNCDDQTLQYFVELLRAGEDCPNTSCLVLCFNESLLFPGTPAWSLLHQLTALSGQTPRSFLEFSIQGFTEADARHYLNECLSWPEMETVNLSETLGLIVRSCGTHPLYLQNMLLFLAQEGILDRTETTSFYVRDIAAFHRAIHIMPRSLEALLYRREKALLEHLAPTPGKQKAYLNLAWLMSILQRVPPLVYRDVIGDFEVLSELTSLGILQQDDDGTVTFWHQLIRRYYRKQYPLQRAPDELLHRLERSILSRGLQGDMAQVLFLVQNTLGKVDDETLNMVLQQLKVHGLDCAYSLELVPSLFRSLDQAPISASERLEVYNHGTQMLSNQFGLDNARQSFQYACKHVLRRPAEYCVLFGRAYYLLKEYKNLLINVGRYLEVEPLLAQMGQFLAFIPGENPDKQNYQARFAIEKCIAYSALNQFEQGKAAAEEAVAAAEAMGNLRLLIQAHMEYGYLYYYHEDTAAYQAELCSQWRMAFQMMREKYLPITYGGEPCPTDHLVDAVYMTGLFVDLMERDYSSARAKAQVLFDMLERTKMPFYEAKIRLCLCAYSIMTACREEPRRVSESLYAMLHQAIDKCVAYSILRDYPAAYHLLATAQMLCGEGTLAEDNYKKAVHLALAYAQNEQRERQWKYLLVDAAWQLRLRNVNLTGLFDKVKDEALRAKCRQIAQMSSGAAAESDVPRLAPLYIEIPALNIAKI